LIEIVQDLLGGNHEQSLTSSSRRLEGSMAGPADDCDPEAASPVVGRTKPRLLSVLGPGLITGASDDDPSGIATYSQAGAQFGYGLTWTMLFTYPLMSAVQMIAARVGRTTGHGIAGVLRRHYPNWLLQVTVVLLLTANTINLGADLGAMADAVHLLLPGPHWLYILFFAGVCIYMQVFLAYTRYVAVLTDIQSSAQAAEALRPIAGNFAFVVFALGIVGTGLLAVPVLAGSAAYALGEARKWPVGFSRRWQEAKAFYGTVAVATLVGMIMNFTAINPIKALYWSAVINGIVAVPVMLMLMLITARKDIMGRFVVTGWLRGVGCVATGLMALAVIAMLITLF
jgi:Mn2+/Fe2+ NRAMP family transporter